MSMTVEKTSQKPMVVRRGQGSDRVEKQKHYLSDKALAYLLVSPALILIMVFAVYPFFIAVINSFNFVDINSGVKTPWGLKTMSQSSLIPRSGNLSSAASVGRRPTWRCRLR